MNIRRQALGEPPTLEAAIAAALKAAEAATAAMEALTVSLMLAASSLKGTAPMPETPEEVADCNCRHGETMEVTTMGGMAVICNQCGETVVDAMHHEQ